MENVTSVYKQKAVEIFCTHSGKLKSNYNNCYGTIRQSAKRHYYIVRVFCSHCHNEMILRP